MRHRAAITVSSRRATATIAFFDPRRRLFFVVDRVFAQLDQHEPSIRVVSDSNQACAKQRSPLDVEDTSRLRRGLLKCLAEPDFTGFGQIDDR